MEPFVAVTGIAAPLLLDDVDTDQIAPMTPLFEVDYAELLFARQRRDPTFVLSREPFRAAKILVAGDNFGCGSSRESAVWALAAFGIRCVIARSFADIFRENCLKNGVLPIVLQSAQAERLEREVVAVDGNAPYTVDLRSQRIITADSGEIAFDLAPGERNALLKGLDDIGLTLEHADDIMQWETRTREELPWLQHLG